MPPVMTPFCHACGGDQLVAVTMFGTFLAGRMVYRCTARDCGEYADVPLALDPKGRPRKTSPPRARPSF